MSTIRELKKAQELRVKLEKEMQKFEIWKIIQATSLNYLLDLLYEIAEEEEVNWKDEENENPGKEIIAKSWHLFRQELFEINGDDCEICLNLTTNKLK